MMDMIGTAVAGLDDLEKLIAIVQELGARHRKWGTPSQIRCRSLSLRRCCRSPNLDSRIEPGRRVYARHPRGLI
jgi:hypothetical protein